MIVTERKPLADILKALEGFKKVFLVGCGECSTICKTGGEPEVLAMKAELEKNGKAVTGFCVPEAPCNASKIKTELAKNMKNLRESEAILIMSCGLGVQSVKINDRLGLTILPALNTMFGAVLDAAGNFYEKCSLCGECVLGSTGGICPITLCPKGLMNGPCGGMNKGKCEVDKNRDCAWVLIYQELEKRNKLGEMKKIKEPRDHKKSGKPHKLVVNQ